MSEKTAALFRPIPKLRN